MADKIQPHSRLSAAAEKISSAPVARFFIKHWVIILAALALVLFLSVVNRFMFFQGGDNAEYFLLARSLARGHGYTDLLTYPPAPHTKYPFLFPAMLAGVMMVFGENVVAMKTMIALFAALSVLGCGLLWKERGEGSQAFFAALLTASSYLTLNHSLRVLSEIPFTALAVFSLVFMERALKRKNPFSRDLVISVAFMIAAALTRSIGVVLALALAAGAMLRAPAGKNLGRKTVMAAVVAGSFLVVIGGWRVRGHIVTGDRDQNYFKEFFMQDPLRGDSPMIGPADLWKRVNTGASYYLDELGIAACPFVSRKSNGLGKMAAAGAVLALLAAAGLIRSLRERRGPPELYLIFYTGMILIWGFNEKRFLIPIFPLLFFYLLKGVEWPASLLEKLGLALERPGRAGAAAFALIMFISFTIDDGDYVRRVRELRRQKGYRINACFEIRPLNMPMSRMLQLAIHLREHAEPESVILARKPRLVALAADRAAVGARAFSPNPDAVLKYLDEHKVDFIIVDELHEKEMQKLYRAVEKHPERFQFVIQADDGNTFIIKYLGHQ